MKTDLKIGDRVRYDDLSLGVLGNYQGIIVADLGNNLVKVRFDGRLFDSVEYTKNLVRL